MNKTISTTVGILIVVFVAVVAGGSVLFFSQEDEKVALIEEIILGKEKVEVVETNEGNDKQKEKENSQEKEIIKNDSEQEKKDNIKEEIAVDVVEEILFAEECREENYELSCKEKCDNLSYINSICKSFSVTPDGIKMKEEFEKNAVNVGETSDCYISKCPRPIIGVYKDCYCFN